MSERDIQSRPTCAVCLRPVDRFTEEQDDHQLRVIFRAYCHGQIERGEAAQFELSAYRTSFSYAFGQPAPQLPGACPVDAAVSDPTPTPTSRVQVITIPPPAMSAEEDHELRRARDADFERRMGELETGETA